MDESLRTDRPSCRLLLPTSAWPRVVPPPLEAALRANSELLVPEWPSRGESLRDLMAAVIAALDRAGAARVEVVGLSFGGQLAQALLQLAPERVAALLLVGSGAPDRARGAALARRRWLWRWLPVARRAPLDWLLASDRDGCAEPVAFAAATLPVTLVELGGDAVIAPTEAARLRALFPQARRVVVPGLGHDALHAWPEPLQRVVTEWCVG